MKSTISKFTAAFLFSTSVCTGTAQSVETQEMCSKEVLLAYFPPNFVKETLGRYKVPQDKWEAIVTELSEKDKGIIKTVENKANQMDPNPLKDPQQRQAAVKIFRETLLDAFSSVLKKHGVTDDKQIQEMLDDVQKQKAQAFADCMQRQKIPQEMQPQVNQAQ